MALDISPLDLIAAERRRQVAVEGYSQELDASHHKHGELAFAAAAYLLPPSVEGRSFMWPWDEGYKPTPDDRVRELVKAGALVLAELDRVLNGRGHVEQEDPLAAERDEQRTLRQQEGRAERRIGGMRYDPDDVPRRGEL